MDRRRAFKIAKEVYQKILLVIDDLEIEANSHDLFIHPPEGISVDDHYFKQDVLKEK